MNRATSELIQPRHQRKRSTPMNKMACLTHLRRGDVSPSTLWAKFRARSTYRCRRTRRCSARFGRCEASYIRADTTTAPAKTIDPDEQDGLPNVVIIMADDLGWRCWSASPSTLWAKFRPKNTYRTVPPDATCQRHCSETRFDYSGGHVFDFRGTLLRNIFRNKHALKPF